jgi:glucose/arabinose dehydrogenase
MSSMRKVLLAASAIAAGWIVIAADQPDGLRLPVGFHASVVAEGLGAIRQLAVRDNGDLYVSTARDQQGNGQGSGIIALRLGASHNAVDVQHFGSVDGGTGIRFHSGALYASSPSGISRFTFTGNALVPTKEPEVIVDGMPTTHPGFNRTNRPIAFDTSGHLFVSVEASANFCAAANAQPNTPPVGLKPCPDLGVRAGIWRFSADKIGQTFPSAGEQWATGVRDLTALAWSAADGNLYAVMHGRDALNRNWPKLISADDEDHVADEMHKVTKGTDFGWPYTYYDGVRKLRLVSPEYGGDGKTTATGYSTPVLTFHSRWAAPVDMLFYSGTSFPSSYRSGAFIVLHGTANKNGYDVVFVPVTKTGQVGESAVFADGFASFDPSATSPPRPKYRPTGAAAGPDGSLYITDSQVGRIWRIAYEGKS